MPYIDGDFIGNYAKAESVSGTARAYGGAIENIGQTNALAQIGTITGEFSNNYAEAISQSGIGQAYGGAIDNIRANIKTIENSVFKNNYASATAEVAADSYGGAISNSNLITNIINSSFYGNYTEANSESGSALAQGGAIHNAGGDISSIINTSFYDNYAEANSESGSALAQGGAIYTTRGIDINADNGESIFKGNYVVNNGVKTSNAIYFDSLSSSSTLSIFKAVNNGKIQFYDSICGSNNANNIIMIEGDGTGTISFYDDVANIHLFISDATIDFANNETFDYQISLLRDSGNTKYNIDLDFATGKADNITVTNASYGTITLNVLNFINNPPNPNESITFQIIHNNVDSSLKLAFGNNIKILGTMDVNTPIISDIVVPNTVYNDEIYMQEGGIKLSTTDTLNDSITIQKEKIYDTLALINDKDTTETKFFMFQTADKYIVSEDLKPTKGNGLNIIGLGKNTPSVIDGNGHTLFKLEDNQNLEITNTIITNAQDYVASTTADNAIIGLHNVSLIDNLIAEDSAAINSSGFVIISANDFDSKFSGNTNAVNMINPNKAINLMANNNGSITFDDAIIGNNGYTINASTDDTSAIYFNNDIKNANINLSSGNINIQNPNNLNNNNSLQVQNATLNLGDLGSNQLHFNNFANSGTINIANVDVDLINKSMGRIYADSYGTHTGTININNLRLLNDALSNITEVPFADSVFADTVKYNGSPVVAYSPIYTYNVQYNKNPEDNLGYFLFIRGSGSSNPSESFNPAVLPTAVSTQSGAYATQMQTFNYAFQHSENFMNIPSLDRLVIKNQNKYAFSPTGDATDVGRMSPLFQQEHEMNGFWVKPYASFENVPLKKGPKVSNINYGTLIGYDSQIKELKHGWDRVLTGYVGYNGSSQRYRGVDSTQNGGLIGVTATHYKGNFFNATTLSVGASAGDTTTMFGHENYTMLLGGIGSKTGYNFEFKDGLFIFQPTMMLSYTFVNTFDYTNAAGVRINSDPMHAIQLTPGVKFIMNTKNGWQPYLAVNMVWNILDKQKVMANDVRLPQMSIKPYVEYGAGVQRCFKDDTMTAFGQAMVHSGGRNGISLTAGLRFKVGKNPKDIKAFSKPIKITKESAKKDKITPDFEKKAKDLKEQRDTKVKNAKNIQNKKNDKKISAPRFKLFGWDILSQN